MAFSNDYPTADQTTAFAIDTATNQLVRIGDVVTPVGSLGFDPDTFVGFDIAGNDNGAWAAMKATGDTNSTLFTIDVATGAATTVVALTQPVRSLAVVGQAVTLYGLLTTNEIVTVLSAAPGPCCRSCLASPSPSRS